VNDKTKAEPEGMEYLQSLPRRWVTIYIPLGIFVFVLLFPFYWMVITAFKPASELALHTSNPFWVISPTLQHFKDLLFNTPFPSWMLNTLIVSVVATVLSLACGTLGAYAIERWQAAREDGTPFDLILMDMRLPDIDGWNATRQLKADDTTRQIPIIALTAHAMSGDREKALDAGCNDYDTKPIELPRLLGKIEALLGTKPPA